jgi:acetylornithine deacetylase/succinyl-diaminopimelate desuccinylase-like protein
MRRVAARFGERPRADIVLEGMAFGRVHHAGIGARRYRFTAQAEGGHSWRHFGPPSALHALLRLGAAIAAWHVPTSPKTTFNIGAISGGTSINTIAREASFDFDLRSEAPAELQALAVRFAEPGVTLTTTVIGDRPAGRLALDHPLARVAAQALAEVGVTAQFEASSTDANISLSHGWPCVCLGITTGAHAHRPDEFIETQWVEKGILALAATVRAMAQRATG